MRNTANIPIYQQPSNEDIRRQTPGERSQRESPVSSISWAAIWGGAIAAIAVSLTLLTLGSAFGLSALSPWTQQNATDRTIASFTTGAAIWLIIMQWIASGIGGYLAGRLRTKWSGVHTDEIFFRDTAHGFLTWSVATVLTAAFLASATAAAMSGGARAGTAIASGAAVGAVNAAAQSAAMPNSNRNPGDIAGYYIDSMFRSNTPNPASLSNQETSMETTRILLNGLRNNALPEADRTYLAQLVAARTGVDQAEATRRTDTVFAQLQDARQRAIQDTERTRQISLKFSIYLFLSLLIGAFIASAAAALGGGRREAY